MLLYINVIDLYIKYIPYIFHIYIQYYVTICSYFIYHILRHENKSDALFQTIFFKLYNLQRFEYCIVDLWNKHSTHFFYKSTTNSELLIKVSLVSLHCRLEQNREKLFKIQKYCFYLGDFDYMEYGWSKVWNIRIYIWKNIFILPLNYSHNLKCNAWAGKCNSKEKKNLDLNMCYIFQYYPTLK